MSTATQQATWNPLYDAWKAKGFVREGIFGWNRPMVTPSEDIHAECLRIGQDHLDRNELCGRYSWAIPGPEAVKSIAEMFPRIVEVGAGRGYWAKVLSDAGVDVVAYEPTVQDGDLSGNHWHASEYEIGLYFDLQQGDATACAKHGNRALLLCWPPYSDPMAATALQAYPGNDLIWIGEGDGGCCGGEDFWEMIRDGWMEQCWWSIPQWPCMRDHVAIYRRKTTRHFDFTEE